MLVQVKRARHRAAAQTTCRHSDNLTDVSSFTWLHQPSTVYAEWGTAIGTVGLAWISWRNIRRETDDRRAAAGTARTDQIAKIAASADIDSEGGVDPKVWVTRARFLVVNSSDSTIHDVVVAMTLLHNGEPASTLGPVTQTCRQEPLFGLNSGWNQLRPADGTFVTWESPWDGVTTEHLATLEWKVTFRDDLGQYWEKRADRRALEISAPN